MLLNANDLTLELTFKTRLVQLFEERMKVENSQNFWLRAAQDENLKVLATALLIFSDKALKTMDDAYAFIDAYLDAGESTTISGLYFELLSGINAKGFFGRKMSGTELRERLEAPVVEMQGLMDKVADNVAAEMLSRAAAPGRS